MDFLVSLGPSGCILYLLSGITNLTLWCCWTWFCSRQRILPGTSMKWPCNCYRSEHLSHTICFYASTLYITAIFAWIVYSIFFSIVYLKLIDLGTQALPLCPQIGDPANRWHLDSSLTAAPPVLCVLLPAVWGAGTDLPRAHSAHLLRFALFQHSYSLIRKLLYWVELFH